MKLKKRKKYSRALGRRTAGTGFRQKRKGHGNSGGYGMSGSGKRGDQKNRMVLMLAKKMGFKSYFGRQGMTSVSTKKRKIEFKSLAYIRDNLFEKEGQKIELNGYRILGGEGFKATIEAASATTGAIKAMEKAGGKIIVQEKKNKKVVEKKEDRGRRK